MFRVILLYIVTFFLSFSIKGQSHFNLNGTQSDRINFKLISNLIVFPVEINNVELMFLLDTGVSKPILFNFFNLNEELKINKTELIYLRGLGEGEPVEALKSSGNIFRIGDAININQDLYAVFDPSLNFAPKLGVPIHGIIGYDFLKDFIVEINYSGKYLKLHNPRTYRPKSCKKCKILDIEFHNNKPYIYGSIEINGVNDIPVKLLIDSGGSGSLWLFEDNDNNIAVPPQFFKDFLGQGLSGSVYGKRSKINSFSIANFKLNNVNAAFPDSSSIHYAKRIKDRNGSVSGNILKRFNLILDFPNQKISLKKNANFNKPFSYNKSGITLQHSGVRVIRELTKGDNLKSPYGNNNSENNVIVFSSTYKYSLAPAFTIVELREGSPAQRAGLQLGDVVVSINNKSVHSFSLQEVIQLFYEETGKRIKLKVDRNGLVLDFNFNLEEILK